MSTKVMKEDNGMEQDREHATEFEDRISELPDAIILHILSFLPTLDTVRMSVLSRRWRHMWTLSPVLDFSDMRDIHYFRRHGGGNDMQKKFHMLVNECLRQPYADTTISKLKLHVEYYGGTSQMDGWLRCLMRENAKMLDLCIWPRYVSVQYCLPHFILRLKALTFLKLSGLTLEALVPTSLPSLKELYLEVTQMDDKVLNNLLLSCSSLEKLLINYCYGLINPKVSSSSLKYMEFRTSGNCQTIEVEAINLHSVFFKRICGRNLVHCRTIRNLSLVEAFLTDQWLEDLIPELSFLESLKLTGCYGFQHIKIQNQHLKHFVFRDQFVFTSRDRLDSQLEAIIDAPNLVSFSYRSNSLFKISVNAPNLLDADIAVCDYPRETYDAEWYTALIKFLSEFNGCRNISIFCSHEKALIVSDAVRKIYSSPLPDLKHMKVRTGGAKLFRKGMLIKSLLWIAPSLETLPRG